MYGDLLQSFVQVKLHLCRPKKKKKSRRGCSEGGSWSSLCIWKTSTHVYKRPHGPLHLGSSEGSRLKVNVTQIEETFLQDASSS